MRLRRWLAIALLSMSSLGVVGCVGVTGDFVIGDGVDASADQFTPTDSAPKSDGTVAPEGDADAGAKDASTLETEPESDASEENAPPRCTLTGPCDPGSTPLGPCMSAEYVCPDGGSSVCVAAPVSNGTTCNDAGVGDAGPAAVTAVCYHGVCGACSAGTECPATNPCQKNVNDCSTGQAVCTDVGLQPDGFQCSAEGGAPALYCNGGKCIPCLVGSSCPPIGALCNEGTVTACASNGQATCTPSARLLANGTACGTNEVCNNGMCEKCTAKAECRPTDNQCHVGQTSCATGQSVCVDTGGWAPNSTTACSDGDPCTLGDACQNGKCVGGPENPCSAIDQCHSTGVCNATTGVCSTPSKANGTSCNEDDNACTSDTCQNGTCKVGNEVTCESPGKCQAAPGACTNKVTGGCTYPASTCGPPGNCQVGTGVCSPTTGQCVYSAAVCNTPGTCEALPGNCSASTGKCIYAAKVCGPPGNCQVGAGVCSPSTGQCGYAAIVCTGVGCQEAVGVCNSSTGQCTYRGTTCAAPTGCETGSGICDAVDGTCSYPVCTAPNECEGAGSCVNGACVYAFLADGFTPAGGICVCDGRGHCIVPVAEAGAPDGGDTE